MFMFEVTPGGMGRMFARTPEARPEEVATAVVRPAEGEGGDNDLLISLYITAIRDM